MVEGRLARMKSEPTDIAERAEDFLRVQEVWLRGDKKAAAIAKELQLRPAYAQQLINEVRAVMQNDDEIRLRAREVVMEFDAQFDEVLKKQYQVFEDARMSDDLKTQATILKNIADTTARRVDVMQKSGLLSSMDLADEMAQNEAKYEALKQLIMDVVKNNPGLKAEVARRLSMIQGSTQNIYNG